MMGTVYGHSHCNIAASGAVDSLGTLFFERDITDIRPLEVTLDWHPKGQLPFFLFEDFSHESFRRQPLNKRGWVLQEQLLAPRALVFAKDQIRWECRTIEACESFPSEIPDPLHGSHLLQSSVAPRSTQFLKKWIASRRPVYVSHSRNDHHKSPWKSFWISWKTVVEEFTSRSLTVSSDKLPAIAGIASMLDLGMQQSKYLAGMWNMRFTIEYELCWRVGKQADGQPSRRPKEYRAPTWSWASVDGQITYHYKRDYDITGDTRLALVENADVITIDGSATGPIKSGFIEIKGPLTEYKNGSYYSDDETVPHPGTIYWLTMFALYLENEVWGLALRRIESGSHESYFERVGTFGFSGKEWYSLLYNAPKQRVTIL